MSSNPLRERAGYQRVVSAVLDRTDAQDGRLPKQLTVSDLTESEERDIVAAFQAGHVKRLSSGRFRIHMQRICRDEYGSDPQRLKSAWYTLMDREPRRLKAEREERVRALRRRLEQRAESPGREEILSALHGGSGWITRLLDDEGLEVAFEEATVYLETLESLPAQEPTRLRRLSSGLHQDTKRLDPGTEQYRWITDHLLERTPDLMGDGDADRSELRQRALEEQNIFRDFTSVRALVYGTLTLEYRDGIDARVQTNANRGLATVLTLDELRQAEIVEPLPALVLTVENETSFNEVAERLGEHVLVVFTEGEANSAVRRVVSMPTLASVPKLHWGDIDAAGFRILHRLQRDAKIDPVLMSEETVHQWSSRLSALPPKKERAMRTGVSEFPQPEAGALEVCLSKGGWLEQEAIPIEDALGVIRERFRSLETPNRGSGSLL